MKTWLMLAALPAALAAQQPAADSLHPITLKQAIALATQNAPAAVAAQGQISSANAAVTSAYANFIPTLSWSMGQSQQSGDRFGQSGTIVPYAAQPWSYSDGLRTSLTLFDGGQRFASVRTAKAGVRSAEANQVAQQFNIALQVKTQYYNILAAEESESAAQAQLDQAVEQLKVSVAKLVAGATTRSDSLRSAIQVGSARLALLTAQNNIKVASAALTRLVATPYLVTATASDTLDQSVTPVDSALLVHLAEQGPAVRSAQAGLTTAQAAYAGSKGSFLPTISVSYSRSGSGFDKYYGIGSGKMAYSKSLSLNLSYNIFDNWTREAQTANASVQVRNAEANLRDADLAAQQNVVQYVANLQTLQEQIQIQQQSIAAAEEDLRVQQQRYGVGASTLLDVLTSETALNQARVQLIQYRLNYRTTKAQIEQLIGRDLQ
ncbi:MAG: TolC family protein [Gemmatimonadota bacterium]|nr:TolC family protein [Gemmatimonadota bacterium]MDE3215446.1 TolC family protein [Gemmatimonadota bacterium]